MKAIKILAVILALGTVVGLLAGCGSAPEEDAPADQVVAVQRGDLTLDISAAGNLALSRTQDLAVDLFYPAGTKGTIGEVLVEEGEEVTEGQALVTLDKDEWDTQLETLANQVTTQERNLTQAESNLLSGQQTLNNLKDNTSKEKAVRSAEVALQQAQNTLDAGFTAVNAQLVLADLNKAKTWYEYVNTTLKQSAVDLDDWTLTYEDAREKLDIAQTKYDNTISGYNTQDVALKKKQVEIAEMTLRSAQKDLADMPQAVALQEIQIKLLEGRLADAAKALEDARENLADAREKSPDIKAPFDGFVTKINVSGGDEVLKGTVAVQLADPDKFEADILVSEMDIAQVKVGGDATVSVDSLTGISLPAKVTHISPTATIQSGVVNYSVKVEVQVSDRLGAGRPFASGNFTANLAEGELPPMLQAAVDAGRMTKEQAQEIQKNLASGNFQRPANIRLPDDIKPPASGDAIAIPRGAFGVFEFSEGSSPVKGQLPAMAITNMQLRQGLTVTVSIIVSNVTDALLVPNAAVTEEGLKSYVRVQTSAGAEEKREVTTGISDWQYTEIKEGLTEGEQVLVPLNTSASSSDQRAGGGMFFGAPRVRG